MTGGFSNVSGTDAAAAVVPSTVADDDQVTGDYDGGNDDDGDGDDFGPSNGTPAGHADCVPNV